MLNKLAALPLPNTVPARVDLTRFSTIAASMLTNATDSFSSSLFSELADRASSYFL